MVEHRLIKELSAPEPFDRAIAHLEMATTTNDLTSGMEVSLAAFFGSEQVSFGLDDGGVLEVDCQIRQAHIVTRHFNCTTVLLDESAERRVVGSELEKTDITNSEESHNSYSNLDLGGEVSSRQLSGLAKVGIGRGRKLGKSTSGKEESIRNKEQVELGLDHIRINENIDGSPLIGKIVNIPNCWRVAPVDNTRPYALVVELRVRRNWMPLTQPKLTKSRPAFRNTLAKLWTSDTVEDEFHRQAFTLLLEHLVKKGLQIEAETTYATLATHALVASPAPDPLDSLVVSGPSTSRKIILPSDLLFQALTYPPTKIAHLLAAEGVSGEEVTKLLQAISPNGQDKLVIEGERTTIVVDSVNYSSWRKIVNWIIRSW